MPKTRSEHHKNSKTREISGKTRAFCCFHGVSSEFLAFSLSLDTEGVLSHGPKAQNDSICAFEKEYISEIESDTDRSRASAQTDSRNPG